MSGANLPANQHLKSFLSSLCSFGGGSEMMRDGDALGILDALAHAQKYDHAIFLVCQIDINFIASSLEMSLSWVMYLG